MAWGHFRLKSTPQGEWEKVKHIKAEIHSDAWAGYSF